MPSIFLLFFEHCNKFDDSYMISTYNTAALTCDEYV